MVKSVASAATAPDQSPAPIATNFKIEFILSPNSPRRLIEKGDRRLRRPLRSFPDGSFPDPEVVRHRKCPVYSSCADIRDVFVGLGVDHALEKDVAILYDEADRLEHWQIITSQRARQVDRAVKRPPNPIVIGRQWQHFDLVVHFLYAVDALDRFLGICLQGGPDHLAN